VHKWALQNRAVQVLRYLQARGVETLEPPIQEELGRNMLQAAEGSLLGLKG
jgi:hypothetical protein